MLWATSEWGNLILTSVFGYKNLTDGADLKRNSCFLWVLWAALSRYSDLVDTIDKLPTDAFKNLMTDGTRSPEPAFLNRLQNQVSPADVIKYLITETLRTQYVVSKTTSPLRGRSRSVSIPKLPKLEIADAFHILRRVASVNSSAAARRHRLVPRCLFPDLQVIPSHIGGGAIAVELVPLPHLTSSVTGLNMCPSLFATQVKYNVHQYPAGGDSYFRFVDLAEGAEGRLGELWQGAATAAGRKQQSTIVFWPELSVDEDTVNKFSRLLQDKTNPDGPKRDLSAGQRLVLPGTFHVESEKQINAPSDIVRSEFSPNRATVYDIDTGELVLEQDKIRPFKYPDSTPPLFEALLSATTLKIAFSDSGTFCVLICKDFVDNRASMVGLLDVDYVLVPSMGKPSTFNAWKRQADDYKRRWGAESSLALQAPPSLDTWVHIPSDEDQIATTARASDDNQLKPS
jgi:hypothetical protein